LRGIRDSHHSRGLCRKRIGSVALGAGEWEVRGDASIETRFDSRTGITSVVPWLVVVRFQQSGDDGRGGSPTQVEQSVEVASSSDAADRRRRIEVGTRIRLPTSERKRQLLRIGRPKD
jgi:hypothetical protein